MNRRPTPLIRTRAFAAFTAIGITGLICVAVLRATALSYSVLPFQATVVDADTGLPIEGVIVDAIWQLETRGRRFAGWLNVTEAVTDTSGVFKMAGWGPLEVPRNFIENGITSPRLPADQPRLVLFKSGYRFGLASNEASPETDYLRYPPMTYDPNQAPYWNGKTIQLKQFVGQDFEYLRHLTGSAWNPLGDCMWTRAPRMTAASIREGERLKQPGRGNELRNLRDFQVRDRSCGSAETILGPFLK
jgi:hypothetical protein